MSPYVLYPGLPTFLIFVHRLVNYLVFCIDNFISILILLHFYIFIFLLFVLIWNTVLFFLTLILLISLLKLKKSNTLLVKFAAKIGLLITPFFSLKLLFNYPLFTLVVRMQNWFFSSKFSIIWLISLILLFNFGLFLPIIFVPFLLRISNISLTRPSLLWILFSQIRLNYGIHCRTMLNHLNQ